MHLGCVSAIPFVAPNRSRKPPERVTRRRQQCLAEIGGRAAEGDPLEALAVVAAAEATDVAVADDAGIEQANGSRGDARSGPSGAIGAPGIERVAESAGDSTRCQQ